MPMISISRGGGWTDRFRRYAVLIDSEQRGVLGVKQRLDVEVPSGRHEVQLRIGLYGSRVLSVDVGESGVALECGPNAIPGLAFLSLARPNDWIRLRETPPPS